MYDPKYAYPYPAPGYYQQGAPPPLVMAPPLQYSYPTQRESTFFEQLLAVFCCGCMFDECCGDPSVQYGSYQQGAPPPMMALPQYAASPERESSCLGQLFAPLCWCCMFDKCCCDPSTTNIYLC
ncbi:uncharacterized protein LOC120256020 [Dioscorea cayenensis subsp. rotundata]|uniref:Uncharacterized protein LOC120256020 n=1 Tax=Dioscorea cayennensis subsp. rotundata TaxID=55577 RepID=A0AB40AZI7_DIOCR|nr:uncharacterized protein LOC120256020 [Dioscorea cayenensis subsp. rotundata]